MRRASDARLATAGPCLPELLTDRRKSFHRLVARKGSAWKPELLSGRLFVLCNHRRDQSKRPN